MIEIYHHTVVFRRADIRKMRMNDKWQYAVPITMEVSPGQVIRLVATGHPDRIAECRKAFIRVDVIHSTPSESIETGMKVIGVTVIGLS